ncbi:GAF domain-containing protein, partial [Rhodanobacter lindaniclasticus]
MRGNTGATAATSESYYAALSEIGQLLVRAVEPPALYEAIIEVLQRRLGAMLVMIGEADHAAGWFLRLAPVTVATDLQEIYPERTPLSLVNPSFWLGEPHVEPDLRHVPGLARLQAAYVRHDVVAAMAIPVMVFGEVRAGLVIRASDPAYFSARLTALLQQAAATIGLGLEAQSQRHQLQRAVQEEARQRRALRLLSEMIKVVTRSPDETVLLADSSDVACRVGGYRFAWVGLLADDAATILRLHAHAGLVGVAAPGDRMALDDPDRVGDAAVGAL